MQYKQQVRNAPSPPLPSKPQSPLRRPSPKPPRQPLTPLRPAQPLSAPTLRLTTPHPLRSSELRRIKRIPDPIREIREKPTGLLFLLHHNPGPPLGPRPGPPRRRRRRLRHRVISVRTRCRRRQRRQRAARARPPRQTEGIPGSGLDLALDEGAALAPRARTRDGAVRRVLLVLEQVAEAADVLDLAVEVEGGSEDGDEDEDGEVGREAGPGLCQVDRAAQEDIEAGFVVDAQRQEGDEVVRERDGQLGDLQAVPRRAFRIRATPHQRAVTPDLDFGQRVEGAGAHVAEPGARDQLACEADLASARARVVYDGESDEREFCFERFDDFGPDYGG